MSYDPQIINILNEALWKIEFTIKYQFKID